MCSRRDHLYQTGALLRASAHTSSLLALQSHRIMKCTAAALAVFGLLCSSATAAHAPLKGLQRQLVTASNDVYLVYMVGSSVPSDMEARIKAVGGTVLQHLSILNRVGIIAVSGLSAEAATQLRSQSDVEAVDLDTASPLMDPNSSARAFQRGGAAEETVQVDGTAVRRLSPGNPADAEKYTVRQWNMRAISADKAWKAGKLGSQSVRVAVLDTGIDYTHVDLVGRVDLGASKSFLPSEDARLQKFFPGAHPIADLGFHLSHHSMHCTALSL
jgi:hypothetical protein